MAHPETGRTIVEFHAVTKHFGNLVRALDGVDFTVTQSERLAIIGPSGSGKSTLLHIACGLDEPTSGAVRIDGVNLSVLEDDSRTRLRREKIGMIFQTFNLLSTLTAIENVALPLRLQGLGWKESGKRAEAMIDRVGLSNRAGHKPDELSGGERQRIAIARALIFEPALLLADEPTGNLDTATGQEILRLLDQMNRDLGITLLLVTHNDAATANCDRVLTLLDGRVVQERQNK